MIKQRFPFTKGLVLFDLNLHFRFPVEEVNLSYLSSITIICTENIYYQVIKISDSYKLSNNYKRGGDYYLNFNVLTGFRD